jgi:hypothetical protein
LGARACLVRDGDDRVGVTSSFDGSSSVLRAKHTSDAFAGCVDVGLPRAQHCGGAPPDRSSAGLVRNISMLLIVI